MLTDEEVAALEVDWKRARAQMRSASGTYEKARREGANPGTITRLRNTYLKRAQTCMDLEKRFFPRRDELDCE